jgi:hypothetical protein
VTESKVISLQIDADPRFAAAAGGAARYLAENSGLENDAASQLQAAVIAACQQAFKSLNQGHARLTVTLSRHSDRIEVEITHEGRSAPAEGAGITASKPLKPTGFDQVRYETRGNVAVTRLTKYISQGMPSR